MYPRLYIYASIVSSLVKELETVEPHYETLYLLIVALFQTLVEPVGVEPTTPCLQSKCSSQLSYDPNCGFETNSLNFLLNFPLNTYYEHVRLEFSAKHGYSSARRTAYIEITFFPKSKRYISI